MFGLADQRRQRAATALGRIGRTTVADCEEFFSSAKGASLSKTELALAKLCEKVKANYNESARLIVGSYGSENNSLRMEIESLQHVKNQLSSLQSRNRETVKSQELLEELATEIAEHFAITGSLEASKTGLETEMAQLSDRIGSVERAIQDIEENPEITSLDTNQRELERLRQELLEQKLSRLRSPLSKFLFVSKGKQDGPGAAEPLSKYMRAPLTSLAREDDGYPGLKEILLGLEKAIETGQVSLDRKKALKIVERMRQIHSGSLLSLQKEAKRALETRKEFLRSEIVKRLQSQRVHLRHEREGLASSRGQLEARVNRVSEEISFKRSKIEGCLGRIEKLAKDEFGKNLSSDLKDKILLLARGQ